MQGAPPARAALPSNSAWAFAGADGSTTGVAGKSESVNGEPASVPPRVTRGVAPPAPLLPFALVLAPPEPFALAPPVPPGAPVARAVNPHPIAPSARTEAERPHDTKKSLRLSDSMSGSTLLVPERTYGRAPIRARPDRERYGSLPADATDSCLP